MNSPSDLSFTESLKSTQRQNFYEGNRPIAIVMIFIVFLAPLVGVMMRGLSGAVWGVVLSVFAYYLTPYVVFKLR